MRKLFIGIAALGLLTCFSPAAQETLNDQDATKVGLPGLVTKVNANFTELYAQPALSNVTVIGDATVGDSLTVNTNATVGGKTTLNGELEVNQATVDINLKATADVVDIAQTNTTGTASTPLINVNDDRTGATANEASEAALYIDSDGAYGLTVADGIVQIEGEVDTAASDILLHPGGGEVAIDGGLHVGSATTTVGDNNAKIDGYLTVIGSITGATIATTAGNGLCYTNHTINGGGAVVTNMNETTKSFMTNFAIQSTVLSVTGVATTVKAFGTNTIIGTGESPVTNFATTANPLVLTNVSAASTNVTAVVPVTPTNMVAYATLTLQYGDLIYGTNGSSATPVTNVTITLTTSAIGSAGTPVLSAVSGGLTLQTGSAIATVTPQTGALSLQTANGVDSVTASTTGTPLTFTPQTDTGVATVTEETGAVTLTGATGSFVKP